MVALVAGTNPGALTVSVVVPGATPFRVAVLELAEPAGSVGVPDTIATPGAALVMASGTLVITVW